MKRNILSRVDFNLNAILTNAFSYGSHGKGLDTKNVEQYLMEGLAVALRFLEHYHENFTSYTPKITGGNCLISDKSFSLNVYDGGFWDIKRCEVSIDFLSGDIFVQDYFTKEKYSYGDYGTKYKKPIDTSIVAEYLPSDYKRDVDHIVDTFDKELLESLLLNQTFTMYNKENDYKGEETVLDSKDVKDIVYDRARVYMNEDKSKLFVKYPYNICTLERNLKGND